jgi:hypothetical protein
MIAVRLPHWTALLLPGTLYCSGDCTEREQCFLFVLTKVQRGDAWMSLGLCTATIVVVDPVFKVNNAVVHVGGSQWAFLSEEFCNLVDWIVGNFVSPEVHSAA